MNKLVTFFLIFAISACAPTNSPNTGTSPIIPPLETSAILKVGAFNIQIFGVSKMSEVPVVAALKQIIPRYDVLLIQEIRDASGESIVELLNEVNAVSQNRYSMVIGSRAGRTSSKEQYAYFYNHQKVSVLSTYEYDDGAEPSADTFEREPFLVHFKVTATSDEFFTVGIHTKPEDAVNEINELAQVYAEGASNFGTSNGIILGDFNADCTYVSDSEFLNLALYTVPSLHWLFSKSGDSTVATTTTCQYDQIVLNDTLKNKVVPSSATVFDFKTSLNLNQTEAADVSDHYPVEVDLAF